MKPTEIQPGVLEENTAIEVKRLKSIPIIGTILGILRKDLPRNLRYHGEPEGGEDMSLTHTEDVLHDAILFALADEKTDGRSLELIGIMAVYHDAGFLDQYTNNEPKGAQRAREAMEQVGSYTNEEIEMVSNAIQATHIDVVDGILKQRRAPNRLAGYLLDADLSNFGRADFRRKSDLVFEEAQLQNPDKPMDKTAFLTATYNFILNHQWSTPGATGLRSTQEEINRNGLAQELGLALQ